MVFLAISPEAPLSDPSWGLIAVLVLILLTFVTTFFRRGRI